MIFAHGTCKKNWENIKKDGFIKPRGNKIGAWYTNIDGHKDLVYLLDERMVAIHHNDSFNGYKAALAYNDDAVVILYIPLEKLDESLLRIDENYLYFLESNTIANCPIAEKLIHREAALHDTRWKESMNKVNMCAYAGNIDISNISRVHEYKIENSIWHRPEFTDYPPEIANTVFDIHTSNCNKIAGNIPHLTVDKFVTIWTETPVTTDEKYIKKYITRMSDIKKENHYEEIVISIT